MPQEQAPKEPWWPTISIAVLAMIIVALGAFLYLEYAHNAELAQQNYGLNSQLQQLNSNKDELTAQVADLTKQISQLKCSEYWDGEACRPFPVSISAAPATGTSPLATTFTIRAKSPDYGIHYGDGSSSRLSGDNSCVPKEDGMCEFKIKHTYRLATTSQAVFEVQVLNDAAVSATTSVTVTK